MGLHSVRVPGLGQNFKQFVVRQEIEPWEGSSFDLEIVLHFLLNFLEFPIVLLEFFEELLAAATVVDEGPLESLHHDVFPEFVDKDKLFILLRQLLLDIFSTEDVFEIHPLTLTGQPLVDDFRD